MSAADHRRPDDQDCGIEMDTRGDKEMDINNKETSVSRRRPKIRKDKDKR